MNKWWDCDAVHCGFWNNEDSSFVHRATLTLPNEWGLILGSFFAMFIALSGSYLWDTVSFLIHQLNASSKAQDESYHQLQLVLRNTDNEGAFITQLSKLAWVHRKSKTKAYYKSLGLILFASIFSLVFALVGGFFTGFIASEHGTVLSVSRHCGFFQEPTLNGNVLGFNLTDFYSYSEDQLYEYFNTITVMHRTVLRRSAAYSRSCYGRFGDNSTACGNYLRPTLPYSITRDVPCPFNDKVCNGTALSLDTGALRSDTDLGISTRPGDALSVRKVLTCAPISGESYTDGWRELPPKYGAPPGTQYKGYSFGSTFRYAADSLSSNYTFVALDGPTLPAGKQPYSLTSKSAILDLPFNPVYEPFSPSPDIVSTSADTAIIGLTNRMAYGTAVTDPWFLAENCTKNPLFFPSSLCKAVEQLSFLGCQEQYQFCKAGTAASSQGTLNSGSCTPLTGLYRLFPDLFLMKGPRWNGTELPDLNPTQKAIYYLLAKTLANSQLHWQLGFIGNENLIASENLWDGGFDFDMSAPLPPNQWEIEVMNWMNVSLANTQRGVVAYGRRSQYDVGGGGVSNLKYLELPEDPDMRGLCDKIRVRSARHTSFSVVAIAVTIAVGLLCILSDFIIHKLFACFQRRTGHGSYKEKEWSSTSVFQLQRMAAEGKGIGPWDGKDKDVPTLVDSGRLFNFVEGSRFGNVESTEYDYGQDNLGFRYSALNKHSAHHEDVELRAVPI
ncbi:hypothetical protein OPT61_g10087 [Boeremia exigua]|uniref:Uncharacterized protein n=1 Tax=Boeremia exigua TaxID=749465 RepID=A0ACC2HS61_9PLEO|nr:hypothetical protein OPT61_g10087 [Boeremia exigua]